MTEWFSQQQAGYIGGFGGAAIGLIGGVYGGLIGLMVQRGIGRRTMMTIHITLIGLGITTLLTGLTALVLGQPYHVWYPFVLGGGVLTCVLGALLRVVRMRYRHSEQRKLEAEALRRG